MFKFLRKGRNEICLNNNQNTEEYETKKEDKNKNIVPLKNNQEKFKSEFIRTYKALSFFYYVNKGNAETLEYYIKKKVNGSLYKYLISQMYLEVEEMNSINKMNNVFCSGIYIKQLMDKSLYCELRNCRNKKINDHAVVEILRDTFVLDSLYYVDEYIMHSLRGNNDNNKINLILLERIEDCDLYEDPHWREMRYFIAIYTYAYSYIKALLFYRNIDNFITNEDLFTMYQNLHNNTDIEVSEIAQKLFPIYDMYYRSIFDDAYNKNEFISFIIILNTYYIHRSQTTVLYCHEISKFKASLIIYDNNSVDKKYNGNNISLGKFENLLDKIDNSEFFAYNDFPYNLNYKYAYGAYALLFDYIIQRIGDYLSPSLFFEIINEKSKYIKRLMEKHRKDEVAKERKRLLKGDLFIEKEEEAIRLNYANITTGYEFEEYLKNTFQKIGYEVVLTKKSGDQGADLIIERNCSRLVVQAKFYSGPVSNRAVQEVVAAIPYYKANKGIVITNSIFTNSAKKLAEANNVILIEGSDLSDLANQILDRTV